MMDYIQYYTDRSDALAARMRSLKARGRGFVTGEIATFLWAVACVVMVTLTDSSHLQLLLWGLAALAVGAYAWVRVLDTRNDRLVQRLDDLRQVYLHEISALGGDYACFDDGQRYADAHHAYTYDLDIFGRDGLYQRLGRLVTTGGSDALAARFCSLDGRGEEVIRMDDSPAYRDRIDALAQDEPFRSEFISYGVREKVDTHAILGALRAASEVRLPSWFGRRWAWVLVLVVLLSFWTWVVLAVMGRVGVMAPLWWGVAQFFAVYLLCTGPLRCISKAVNRLHGQIQRLVGLVALADPDHADVFRRVSALLDGLDRRGNILGLMLVDTLALSDFFLVRKFLRWQSADAAEMAQCVDRVVRMDQDITVATYRYNHPRTTWAVVTDEEGVSFEATALSHPFLGEKGVPNDFRIDDRHFYIVTGANMAGKSTFLRAVGVNYLLARTGFPVFAQSLRVSRFKLFSSMRTSDDLAHGISFFNAELLRLRQLLATLTPAGEPSLIILDEILKGTNSLDKLNGSRLFLQAVAHLPVSGIVATHDLELSRMEGGQYHNYCFEIELGNDVTYTYRISPGVAHHQNATFLLKQILDEFQ